MAARRYLAVVQDPRGYPAPGEPLEAAPPEGPAQPVIHTVVLADEYDDLAAKVARLQVELDEAEERYDELLSRCGGTMPG